MTFASLSRSSIQSYYSDDSTQQMSSQYQISHDTIGPLHHHY